MGGRPFRLLMADDPDDDGRARQSVYAFRTAGMEVIWTRLANPLETVVRVAIQEDVDAIGLPASRLPSLLPRLVELLQAQDAADIPVFGVAGGTGEAAAPCSGPGPRSGFPAGLGITTVFPPHVGPDHVFRLVRSRHVDVQESKERVWRS